MKDFAEAYVQRQERKPYVRTSLTAGQHILHLLLTVFTCGLWIPVWVIRAAQGNKRLAARNDCYGCGRPAYEHGPAPDRKCPAVPGV